MRARRGATLMMSSPPGGGGIPPPWGAGILTYEFGDGETTVRPHQAASRTFSLPCPERGQETPEWSSSSREQLCGWRRGLRALRGEGMTLSTSLPRQSPAPAFWGDARGQSSTPVPPRGNHAGTVETLMELDKICGIC